MSQLVQTNCAVKKMVHQVSNVRQAGTDSRVALGTHRMVEHDHGLDLPVNTRHARYVALLDDFDCFLNASLLVDAQFDHSLGSLAKLAHQPGAKVTHSSRPKHRQPRESECGKTTSHKCQEYEYTLHFFT